MPRTLGLRHALTLLLLVLLVPLAVGGAPASAPAQEVAHWLPADTPIVLDVGRPAALRPLLDDWKLAELLADQPGVKSFYDNPALRQARLVLDVLAAQLMTTPLDLLDDLAGGGATLAVEGKDQVLAVLRPNRADRLQPTLDAVLDLARNDARDKGHPEPFITALHQGVAITSFSPRGAVAIVDGFLVVASDADRLKALLDARSNPGAGGRLADDPRYVRFRGSVDESAAAWVYARLDKIRALDPKMAAPNAGDETGGRFLLGRWYDLFWKGDAVGGQVIIQPDTVTAQLRLAVPAEVRDGPLDVFRPREVAARAPLMPADTLVSATLWRDMSAVWESRDQWLSPEALKGLAQLDSFAGQFFGGRDFGTGVLGSLGQQWGVVVAHQNYDAQKPAPGTRFPGVALIIPIDPDDEEFAVRLQSAFQSFVGLVNLGAAQTKAPPLMLGSEQVEGVTLFRAAFVPPRDAPQDEPADDRFNLTPSAALVGDSFVLASSSDVARTVIRALKSRGSPANGSVDAPAAGPGAPLPTLRVVANGAEVGRVVQLNREVLISRNVLEKGNSRDTAAREIDLLATLLRVVKTARLEVYDTPDEVRVELRIDRGTIDAK
jgi:hypothetical protein